MEQEKVFSINLKLVLTKAMQLAICVAIAVAAPYFGQQLITGTIVNALLFISVAVMGIESAFLLCLIPSLISIYTGLLPLSLAPMVPFIMTGNALLVLTFWNLRKHYWLGAISASIIKFLFIWSVGMLLAQTILHNISKAVMLIISWPQLVTALAGACLAYIFLNFIKQWKK